MTRVLVTGGAGFIGSMLVARMVQEGHDVVAVDDLSAGSRESIPDEAALETIDIRSSKLGPLIANLRPDVVYHLAALHFVPECNEDPEATFEINVMGTRNLLRGVAEAGTVERVVYTSSAAVYPPVSVPLAEDTVPEPTDIYGRTKLIGEDLAEGFALRTGVPTVTARLFNVYGPNDTNPHLIPEIIDQLAADPNEVQLGNLSPERDFIHVSDVVDALWTLGQEFSEQYDTFNVGTGTTHSVRDVAKLAIEKSGSHAKLSQTDSRSRESDRPHLQADSSKLTATYGWEPRFDLATGLEALLHRIG